MGVIQHNFSTHLYTKLCVCTTETLETSKISQRTNTPHNAKKEISLLAKNNAPCKQEENETQWIRPNTTSRDYMMKYVTFTVDIKKSFHSVIVK